MIEVKDLRKVYPTKERDFIALNDLNLKFDAGEFIAVLGESGSGKTTFLNMISGVDLKTSGKIFFNEKDVDKFNDAKWREIRNQEIGFIFQRFNLIDHLTVMENVVLPLILTGSDNNIAREIARRLLKEVELEGTEDKLAKELSGGQRQRVAIARTIIVNPTIILADEPTGALDSTTGLEIMKLLQKFSAGRIIIMVTHDEDLAYKNATRVIRLHDGEVISDEIIKEKNSTTRDTTNRLLSYETRVSRRLKKRLMKQFPEIEDQLVVGKKCYVPLERKYIANNPVFTRKIARENFKQKIKINRRILLSFVISISLLLIVNIVMKNISAYNFNLFDINNNYVQYLISDYEGEEYSEITGFPLTGATDTIYTDLETNIVYRWEAGSYVEFFNNIDGTSNVDEILPYYEHYVQEMYLVSDVGNLAITSNVSTVNKGVFSPKMVTLPVDSDNFYLTNQIIVGGYPTNDNEIIVSSEFILARFYGYSLEKIYNQNTVLEVTNLNSFVGQRLYICGETIISDGAVPTSTIEDNCFEYIIRGVLNSYYNGISYPGNIYVPNTGFTDYITYLRDEKDFTRVDEYYDTYLAFYLKDIDTGIDITAVSTALDVTISNEELREYNETKTLENMLYYIYLAIFISLIIISGTIDINIVASSVVSRIREIGIYSCIGVSKKSIRNMFVFETLEIAIRILFVNSIIFGAIAFGFKLLYKRIVVDLTIYESIFGGNEMFSYEITFSVMVILGAVVFLFASVLVPSFKAANMRAIDALRSE